jgi:ATP-binding cassette subfamily B protein RaxB
LNSKIKLGKLNIFFASLNNILFGIENVVVIYIGATLAMEGDLSPGMIIAFLAYKGTFVDSSINVVEHTIQFKMLNLYLSRVSDIALTERERSLNGKDPQHIHGNLQLKNISFRFGKDSPFLFHNINLSIDAGQSVAIIGPSGCGKTTLLKVMLGLIEATDGDVLLDGIPINDIGLRNYRKRIGAVMQDDVLLAGSIQDNITFYDDEIDHDFMIECATIARIDADIKGMVMGYHTIVGDNGTNLSGGQKQRIYLARALYRKPKILFLDEATSHLDDNNEININESLKKLQITKIIVAHRRETIEMAQFVIKLENGGIRVS